MSSLLDKIFGTLLDPALKATARGLDRLWGRPALAYDRTRDRWWTATYQKSSFTVMGLGETRRAAVIDCLTKATKLKIYSGSV